jgi:hypothetical protein
MDVQSLLDAGLNDAANNEVQKTVPQQLAQYVPSDIDVRTARYRAYYENDGFKLSFHVY